MHGTLELRVVTDDLAARRARQLDLQLTRLQIQHEAVVSAVIAQAMFTWMTNWPETAPPLTDQQITDHERGLRKHYLQIALKATAVKGGLS